MKYSLQSYRVLYNRIYSMWVALAGISEKQRTESQTVAMHSLNDQLVEYAHKMAVLGYQHDQFLKVV